MRAHGHGRAGIARGLIRDRPGPRVSRAGLAAQRSTTTRATVVSDW